MSTDTAIRIKAVIAAIMGFVTELIGWQGAMFLVYAVLMLIDWITGTQAAKAAGEWSSEVAKKGLRSKGNTIGVIVVALALDWMLCTIAESGFGFSVPLNGTIFTPLVLIWYSLTECGSIVENAGKNGAPVPKWLAKGIKVFKAQVDKKGEQGQQEEKDTGWEMEHSASEDDEE